MEMIGKHSLLVYEILKIFKFKSKTIFFQSSFEHLYLGYP